MAVFESHSLRQTVSIAENFCLKFPKHSQIPAIFRDYHLPNRNVVNELLR
jgi:hypothetical protein